MSTFSNKQLFDRLYDAMTTDGSGNVALRFVSSGYAAASINDTAINWGTGANQVSGVDMPIADAGSYFTTKNVEAALQQLGAADAVAGAPVGATYITQTANGVLTNEQALGSLATGIVKNTTTTGVLSIATQGTDYYAPAGTKVALADGGSNAALAASLGGIVYSTASALSVLAGTATAGQMLLSGAFAAPAWSTVTHPTTTTINQLLYSSAANVLAGLATANSGVLITSSGGVPSISTDIPTAVTIGSGYIYRAGGTKVALADGGANAALSASNGGIVYSTASALAVLAGTATAGQLLQSGASTTPSWTTATFPSTASGTGSILRANGTNWLASTATYPDTVGISTILYGSASNVVSALATANNGVLMTGATGIPAWLAAGATGYVLTMGATAPAWAASSSVPRVTTVTSNATPTLNTDNADALTITALAVAITSMTTNLSGTATNFQNLVIRFKDNGTARAISWGTSFEGRGVTLPTTTTAGETLTVRFIYDTVRAKWGGWSSIVSVFSGTLKVLVIGGGGGASSGGGGAGGYQYDASQTVAAQAYAVTVGNGGSGAAPNPGTANTAGQSSVFNTLTATGGGRGGGVNLNGANGASGGGAGSSSAAATAGTGTAGQGNNGGVNNTSGSLHSGGGGGAGAAGGDAGASVGGVGGAGTSNSITGASVVYSGGGGGAPYNAGGTGGAGGAGGGGAGNAAGNGTAGTANTGGGGGGANNPNTGGAGGSGVVVISYVTANFGTCTGGTITTDGANTVHTFNSSGTFTVVGN